MPRNALYLAALAAALLACNAPTGPAGGFRVQSVRYDSTSGITPSTATSPLPSIRATFSDEALPGTLPGSVSIIAPDGSSVPVALSTANFTNSVTVTPRRELATSATYRVAFSGAIRSASGAPLEPYEESFTVRAEPLPPASLERHALDVPGGVQHPTSLTFAPDGTLFVAERGGRILALTLNADGTVGAERVIAALEGRSVLGVAARDHAGRIELWVTHAALPDGPGPTYPDVDPYSSAVTVLSGADFAARHDVIVGLPRSAEAHQVNGLAFGANDRLFVAIGGNTNFGAPSERFGSRPERLLGSAVLVADLALIGERTIDARPAVEGGAYPVDGGTARSTSGLSADAPVKVFASGFRNPYDVVVARDGTVYATDNGGNAGIGSTPGEADGCPGFTPTSPDDQQDEVNVVVEGAYYGHPNPSRGECAFDGGANYRAPALLTGLNRSTDGLAEFDAPAVAGADLEPGDLVYVNFSTTKALYRFRPGAAGSGRNALVAEGFNNPLDVAVGPDGAVFVAEFGGFDATDKGGIVVLEPKR